MKGFRDLEIFNESKRLAIIVHEMSLTLPKFECYEEGSQLRRSSKAISALIAEGFGRRRYQADYIRYLILSHAECDEVSVHLDFIYETKSLRDSDLYLKLKAEYESLGKKISRFIKWVQEHENKNI
jgi:four helix bundle protein